MDMDVLKRSLAREKAQRNLAEQLLEDKSRELFHSYEQLKNSHSELEKAHSEVHEKQEQLVQSEKMASLGIMSAGVAHEINNPLAFVFGNVNSLSHAVEQFKIYHDLIDKMMRSEQSSISPSERQEIEAFRKKSDLDFLFEDCTELIEETVQGIQRVKGIVSGLKAFARADSSERESVDVNLCIKNTLKVAGGQLNAGCKIVEKLGDLSEISGFPGKIGQVILNLIVNASHAVDENGEVTIATSQDDAMVTISVSDNGCGMSKETLDQLFTPFFTTKPVGGGTGLGLSISHGIVEEHEGEIKVESELGKGTCFTIRLPRNQNSDQKAA